MNDNQNAFLVVKKYEFNTPSKDNINYRINDIIIKNCAVKYFHSFKYKCKYVIKFISLENKEEIILDIIINDNCKNQFKEICKKNQKCEKK